MRIALIIVLAALAFGSAGCWLFRLPAPPVLTAPAETFEERAREQAHAMKETSLEDQRDEAFRIRDEADSRIKSLSRLIVTREEEHQSRNCLWASLLCVIGFGVSIAAVFWMPVGKKTAGFFATVFASVGILMIVVRALIPYLTWCVPAVFGIGGIIAVVRFGPYLVTLFEVAVHGNAVTAKGQKIVAKLKTNFQRSVTKRLRK